MKIVVTTAQNQVISNRIVQNVGEETIEEMKIQKVSEHGNKEKQQMMIMMKCKLVFYGTR